MTTHPIPASALDDRLGYVGTAGSGKTYNAGSGVERLLNSGARIVIPDPLGVWWGLALASDSKTPSVYREKEKLIIFGGPRGDLGLTEHSGALIGETVAGMAESCILDLSELGTKAAERRFMLAFLTALYKNKTKEPLHVVFDEADMWAPQRLLDKEGEAAKLLGMMETVVRRGRVRGFIPWLITQRPAVLSKDVLSQIDGLIAFKLTSSQDRDAIGDWVQGQADKEQWKQIWAMLPTMERGQGVVWLPARGVLKTAAFPEKTTFDSSRAPSRGERVPSAKPLQPVNLGKLKERLVTVEAEAKASDPKALRAELGRARDEIRKLQAAPAAKPDRVAIEEAEKRGFERAQKKLAAAAEREAQDKIVAALDAVRAALVPGLEAIGAAVHEAKKVRPEVRVEYEPERRAPVAARPAPAPRTNGHAAPSRRAAAPAEGLSRSEQRIIDAIRWWNVLGIAAPSHPQVGFIAGYSHKSGTWATYLSRLRSAEMIEGRGDLVLTDAGRTAANEPDAPPTGDRLRSTVLDKVDGPLKRILSPIIEAYPDALSHQQASESAGYSSQSGTWATYLSRLRSLELIESRGELRAQDWLFP